MRFVAVGLWAAFLAFLVLGFFIVVAYATITPAREAVQDFAVCRGADRIDRQDVRSTQRRTTSGGFRDVGASTTDLTCHYGDDVRQVSNDAAFLRGGGYALTGTAIAAAAIGMTYGLRVGLRHDRRREAVRPS